jgi:hypothetical protein
MDQKDVFALALGLAGTPWTVVGVRFDPELKRLDIEVDFPPGSRFPHPDTGQASPVYDSEPRSWRHMNFFQFECYVKAHVPRVDGGPGSGAQRAEILAAFDQSGVSAAEFARLVGVKYPTLAGWLHRRGRPRGEVGPGRSPAVRFVEAAVPATSRAATPSGPTCGAKVTRWTT